MERAGREGDPADAARGDRRRDLPSVHLTALDITLGAAALVAANLAIATWAGRSVHFALLLAINFILIYTGSRALSDRGNLPVATGLFYAYLTTLIVVLYDTYRPLRAARDRP